VTSALGSNKPAGEGSDGEELKVLRPDDTRVCFPVIPFVLSLMPTFREATGSVGVNFGDLTFENYCIQGSYVGRLRDIVESFGFSALSDTAMWLGVPGLLRGAEAVDAVDGFVGASAGGAEGVGSVICALTELGGILYVVVLLIVLLVAFPLVNVVNVLVGVLYDVVVLASSAVPTPDAPGQKPSESKPSEPKPSEKKPSGSKPNEKKPNEKKPNEKKPNEKKKGLARVFSRSRRSGANDASKAKENERIAALDAEVATLKRDITRLKFYDSRTYEDRQDLARRIDRLYDRGLEARSGLRSAVDAKLRELRKTLEELMSSKDASVRQFASREAYRLNQKIAALEASSVRGTTSATSAPPVGVFSAIAGRVFGGAEYEGVSPDSSSESGTEDAAARV
jgi:hypothetical protein